METSVTGKVICNISSENVEVNLEAFDRVGDSAIMYDCDSDTHTSLDDMNMHSDELPVAEKNTKMGKKKDRISSTKSIKRRIYILEAVVVILLLAISVGIVYVLLSPKSEDIPPHGSISDVTGESFQATVTFKCEEGFYQEGNSVIRCQENGLWTTYPICNNSDDCTSSHCGNGTCIDGINNYTCACNPGFTGTRCERDIDECTSSDCGNGSCIDGINNYICACTPGFTGKSCERVLTDCYDLYHFAGQIFDGVYTIVTWKTHQNIKVYCDMTTDGGGWTVFHYRFNGSLDFYRNFTEYKHGFGNLNSEFWLGLNCIQEISSQGQTDLRINLESANGTRAFEQFENFYLSPGPDFTLHLGRTTNSIHISDTYSFGPYHNGGSFSTYDRDLDTDTGNCAASYKGGWWYKYCFVANLNGIYNSTMYYHSFIVDHSLKMSKMMFRRT